MPYLGVRAGSVIVIYPGDDDDDDVWESPSFLESRGEMYDSEDDDKDDDEECASSGPGGSKPKQPAPHSKKPSFRKPAAQRGGWKKVRDAADFEEGNWLLFRRNAVQETSRNWVFKYSKTLRNGSKTAVYKCGDDNCDAELKVTEGCAPDKGIIEQKGDHEGQVARWEGMGVGGEFHAEVVASLAGGGPSYVLELLVEKYGPGGTHDDKAKYTRIPDLEKIASLAKYRGPSAVSEIDNMASVRAHVHGKMLTTKEEFDALTECVVQNANEFKRARA